MRQTAPIAQSITALWIANNGITTLIPGGLLYGKVVKAGTKRPFAVMEVTLEGDPEFTTGLLYGQDYRLRIAVASTQAVGNAGAIQAALESLLSANTKLANLTNNAWTLHCSLEPAGVEEELVRNLGQFTFVAGATWIIQLQESRT